MANPEVVIFGIPLGPVALILIGNTIFIFILMNADAFLGRITGRLGPNYTRYFLVMVFLFFVVFSSAPYVFGLQATDLALIFGTVLLFGLFIPGFGVSNLKRNFVIMVVAILGSIVGYNFARMFLTPIT